MIKNGCLELEKNAPFEEIDRDWYIQLLEGVPPERWCSPYQDCGWFIVGEPHSHDWDTGEPYHYLCFNYSGRYFAGCRSLEMSTNDIVAEIDAFCRNLEM